MDENSFPIVSNELVRALEQRYPDRLTTLKPEELTNGAALIQMGRLKLIEFLRAMNERQTKRTR